MPTTYFVSRIYLDTDAYENKVEDLIETEDSEYAHETCRKLQDEAGENESFVVNSIFI